MEVPLDYCCQKLKRKRGGVGPVLLIHLEEFVILVFHINELAVIIGGTWVFAVTENSGEFSLRRSGPHFKHHFLTLVQISQPADAHP